MTISAPHLSRPDLVSDLLDHELDAELRAQVVVDVALRHDLDPLKLASWIFKPLPSGRRLKVPGIRRWGLSDDIELQSPDYQVPPVFGESAWSFASRIAAANGYIGAADAKRFAIHYFDMQKGNLKSSAYKWFFLAPRFCEEVNKWLGGREAVVWSADRWLAKRPFCPECIRREVVFMERWQRDDAETCEEHQSPLQSRCASCGDELTWATGSINACRCGAEFRRGQVSRGMIPQALYERDHRLMTEPLGTSNIAAQDSRDSSPAWTVSASPGGCHFGWCACCKVSIELGGAPLAVGLCHCSGCRRTTGGSGFAFLEYATDRVSVRGVTTRRSRGECGVRVACNACGQALLVSQSESEICRVHAGILGDRGVVFEPQFEQWVSQRRGWACALDVEQFEQERPPISTD